MRLKDLLNPNVVAMLATLACQLGGVPTYGWATDFPATLGAAATPLAAWAIGV